MSQQVVPMLHVPDVERTVAFYERLGFAVRQTYEDEGELSFAIMRYGDSLVMLNCGGSPSTSARRDADLYIYADVNALYPQLAQFAELVGDLNDTFYGMREFTIRVLNGFWITFAKAMPAPEA